MILRYFALAISAILFATWLALLGIGAYREFKYSYKSRSPITPLRRSIKYPLWGALCLGLSVLIFSNTEFGFSWENLCFGIGMFIMMTGLALLHYFIRLKVTTSLYKESVPFSSLWKDEQTGGTTKLKSEKQNGETGKER